MAKDLWRNTIVAEDTSVRAAIEAIDRGGLHIALVVDAQGRLAGIVTDGDVRRAVLSGTDLTQPVHTVMKRDPSVVRVGDGREKAVRKMREAGVGVLPILDKDGKPAGLETLFEHIGGAAEGSCAVLMAGGFGRRLAPLTDSTPKPLIAVGDRPILQIILEGLLQHGFRKFYISVNYKAAQIIEHFGDGSAWGAEIEYLQETVPLGTAGSLSLLPARPEAPFLVMNGDLLTQLDFTALIDFHRNQGGPATMCVREHQIQIPYGVAEAEGPALLSVVEKPVYTTLVNAGIYVLSPEALDFIPREAFFDMPSLFNTLASKGSRPSVFPIREYWLDIGRMEDLERAQVDVGRFQIGGERQSAEINGGARRLDAAALRREP